MLLTNELWTPEYSGVKLLVWTLAEILDFRTVGVGDRKSVSYRLLVASAGCLACRVGRGRPIHPHRACYWFDFGDQKASVLERNQNGAIGEKNGANS